MKEIKNSSIVDAGCGFAEFYNYLKIKKLEPKSYIGYDIEEFMIEKSSNMYPHLKFQKKNILKNKLEEADYYICSGAMNILTKNEMFLFIDNCFNASKKGFVFNFLQEDSFNNVSVSDVLSHCKNLCNKIHINNNYLRNDITIYLNKDYLTN